MCRECQERFPRHQLQRKPLVSDPGMHHGTCVTRVPWCMSGSLTRCGGEHVPGIPGACATRNFTYLARGLWSQHVIIAHKTGLNEDPFQHFEWQILNFNTISTYLTHQVLKTFFNVSRYRSKCINKDAHLKLFQHNSLLTENIWQTNVIGKLKMHIYAKKIQNKFINTNWCQMRWSISNLYEAGEYVCQFLLQEIFNYAYPYCNK